MAAPELDASWPAHKSGLRAAAFSADGSVLFTGGADGHIRAWAAAAGWKAASPLFERLAAPVHALALSGGRLFSASRDGAVCVWNAEHGTREAALEPRSGAALALAVAGPTLAASFAGAVLVWSSAPPFAVKNTVRGVGCACGALALTADGSLLFTGCADGRVAAWRTAQDERSGLQSGTTLGTHDAAVLALALSPDGTRLFSACGAGDVRCWTVRRDGLGVLQTAGALLSFWRMPGGGSVRALAAAGARAGAALVFTGGDDGAVRAWAPPPFTLSSGSDALTPRAQDWVLSLAVSHAGGKAEALLAAGGADGVCRVWRVGDLLVRASAPVVPLPASLTTLGSDVPPPPMMPPPQADEHVFPVPLREERAAARDALLREQDAYRARAAAFARAQQAAAPPTKAAGGDKAQPASAAPPAGGWRGGFGLDRHQAALARMYGPHVVTHQALANAGMLPQIGAMPPGAHPAAFGAVQSLPGGWSGGLPLPPSGMPPGANYAAYGATQTLPAGGLGGAPPLVPGAVPPASYATLGATQTLPDSWGGGPPLPVAPGAAWAAGTGADGWAYGAQPYGLAPTQAQAAAWTGQGSTAPGAYQ